MTMASNVNNPSYDYTVHKYLGLIHMIPVSRNADMFQIGKGKCDRVYNKFLLCCGRSRILQGHGRLFVFFSSYLGPISDWSHLNYF